MMVSELRAGTRVTDNPVQVLKVLDIKTPSRYPPRQLVIFRVEESPEAKMVWFTSGIKDLEAKMPIGSAFYLTGTVKRQSSHDGEPQTEVVGITLTPIRP